MATSKKELILTRATELFLAQGPSQVTMDHIAKQTPVSKMTIYKYFKDKESLVEAAVRGLIDKFARQLEELIEQAPTPVVAIEQLFSFKPEPEISGELILDLTEHYPQLVADLLSGSQKFFFGSFQELIHRAQREGIIRRELSPHVIVLCLLAIKEFFAKPGRFHQHSEMLLLGEQVSTIFLHGILQNPGDLPEAAERGKL